jgi:hypothetical protein
MAACAVIPGIAAMARLATMQNIAVGRRNGNVRGGMFGQPMFGQPMFGQPMFGQPMFGQPMFGQPCPDCNIPHTESGLGCRP